ncbi:hypothetical protein C0Q70_09273 [Pomacea canaliculata]|uniref:Uncharacterized protein n=1 Tax=Pomacea canaliculata TaxID=400727 RepID=A0A2T7P9B5_POMCA|nr:hypothetical protein C0Q70_09273 [Pomacea canaliculata]
MTATRDQRSVESVGKEHEVLLVMALGCHGARNTRTQQNARAGSEGQGSIVSCSLSIKHLFARLTTNATRTT